MSANKRRRKDRGKKEGKTTRKGNYYPNSGTFSLE